MRTVDADTGIVFLERPECLALLAHEQIGRLAVVVGGAPAIFPVNYVLDGDAIVFRTDPGTKFDHGPRATACFEIDAFDRQRRTGWSVVVTGRLEEVTSYDWPAFERIRELRLVPWAGGAKEHWMRLVPARITGRQVETVSP